MARGYRDLVAWQKAMTLVTAAYRATRGFPPDERFGLCTQMRRAAVSVPSNIAEGHGRNSRGEFVQFLGMARGSLCELETQIEVAMALEYIDDGVGSRLLELAAEVGRVLNGLMTSLKPGIQSGGQELTTEN